MPYLQRTLTLALLLSPALSPAFANGDVPWVSGDPELTTIGALAFGPDGILFVGDAEGASVLAIETADTTEGALPSDLNIADVSARLAALTGASSDQIHIHDLAVNPLSGRAYLSVTRDGAKESQAMLVRVDGPETLEILELPELRHSRLTLDDAPAPGGSGRRNQRAMAVTDLEFHDGQLYVAGLSNEEFASKLRVFQWPFDGKDEGSNVEIFHGAHGKWETRSPIRTFLTMEIDGSPHLLAGYTCTPLVTFPVKEMAASKKLRGTTVAELGNRNTPLDMVLYEKDGSEFLLVANTSRGVMKVSTDNISTQEGIVSRVKGTSGLGYETIADISGVTQLAAHGTDRALILVEDEGVSSLRSIALP